MTRFQEYTVAINIVGLAIITALEQWRPGFVSLGLSFGWIWLMVLAVISLVLLVPSEHYDTRHDTTTTRSG